MKTMVFIMIAIAAMLFGVAGTAAAIDQININTAAKEELMTLDGIGEAYAQAIIEYREANGPFKAPGDIVNVKGIGPATYEKNKDRITVAAPDNTKPGPPK